MNLGNRGNEELKFLHMVLVRWPKTRSSFVFFHLYQSSVPFLTFFNDKRFPISCTSNRRERRCLEGDKKVLEFSLFFHFRTINPRTLIRLIRSSSRPQELAASFEIHLNQLPFLLPILFSRLDYSEYTFAFLLYFLDFLSKFSSLYQLIIHG